jgi:hypothetical protein
MLTTFLLLIFEIGNARFGLIALKNSGLIAGRVADSLSVLREVDSDDGTEAGSAGVAVL